MSPPCPRPATAVEAEAAVRLSRLVRREFGLSPKGERAELGRAELRVRLRDALSPLGRLILARPEGTAVLDGAYAALHEANREALHRLAERITGRAVRASWTEVSAGGDVSLTFILEDF